MANLAFAITVDALDALKSLGSVGKAFIDLTKEAQQFGKELANINSIAFLSDKALGKLRDDVVNLSKSIPTAGVTELSQGLYQLYSSGFQGSKALDVLSMSAKAATAGMSTIAESSTVIASVLNSYGQDVLSANKATDLLLSTVQLGVTTFPELATSLGNVLPTASSAKISFEELTAGIIELTKNGVPTSQAMTALNQVMISLLDPTPEVAKLAKNLGIEFGATALASKGLNGVLQDVMKASNGNIEVMSGLFGSVDALKGAMILTKNAGKDFAKSIEEQGKSAGATQKSYDEQMKSYDASIKTLQNSISIMKTEFGEMAIKVLKPMIENFSSLIQLFNDTDKTTKQVTIALSVLTFTISSLIIAFKALNAVIIQHTAIGIIAHLQNMTASMILFTGSVSASIAVLSAGAIAIGGLVAIGYQFMKMQQAKKQAQEDENRNTDIYNSHIERRKELEEKQRKGTKLTKDETLDLAKAFAVLATQEGIDQNLKKAMVKRSDELIEKSKQLKDATKDTANAVKLTDKELESMLEQGKLTVSSLTEFLKQGRISKDTYTKMLSEIDSFEKKRTNDLKQEQEKRKNDYINAQKSANETAKDLQRSRIEQQEDSLKKEIALIKNSYQAKVDEQNELAKKGANVKSNIVEIRRQEQVAIAKATAEFNKKAKEEQEKNDKEYQQKLQDKLAKEFEVAQLRASLIDDEVKKEEYLYKTSVDHAKKIYANDSTLTLRLQVLEKEHSAKIKAIKQSMYEEALKLRKEYNDALKSLQDIERSNEEKFYDTLLQDSEEIIKEAEHRLSISQITQKQYTNIVKQETEAQIVYIQDALKSSTLSEDKKFEYKTKKINLSRKLEKDSHDEEEKLRKDSLDKQDEDFEKEKKQVQEREEQYRRSQEKIINSLYAIGDALRSLSNNELANLGVSLQESLKDFGTTAKAMEGDISAIIELTAKALGSVETAFMEYSKEIESSGDSTRAFLSSVWEGLKDFPLVGFLAQLIEVIAGAFGVEFPADSRRSLEELKKAMIDLSQTSKDLQSANLKLANDIADTIESRLAILRDNYTNTLSDIIVKSNDLLKQYLKATTQEEKDLILKNMRELGEQTRLTEKKYYNDRQKLSQDNVKKLANDELELSKLKAELIEDEIAQENFLYKSIVANTKKIYADDKNLNIRLEVLEKQHNDKMKSLAEKRVSEGLKLAEKKFRAEKGFSDLTEKQLELNLKNNKDILDNLYEALDLFEKEREKLRKKLPAETNETFTQQLEQVRKLYDLDPRFYDTPIAEFDRMEIETRQRIENELATGKITNAEALQSFQDMAISNYLYMENIEKKLVKGTKERTEYEGKKFKAFKDYKDLALELYDAQTEVMKQEKMKPIETQQQVVDIIEKELDTQREALDTHLKETEISLLKTANDFSDIINNALGNVASSAKTVSKTTSAITPIGNTLSEDTRSDLLTKIANASGNNSTVWQQVSDAYNNRDDATLMNLANQFGISYKKETTATSTAKPSNSNMYAENYTTKSGTSSTATLTNDSLGSVSDKDAQIMAMAKVMLNSNTPSYETEQDKQKRLDGYISWIKSFDDATFARYKENYIPRFATGGISNGGLVMTEPREMLLNDSQQKKLFNILNGQTTTNNSNSININIGNMSGNQQDINKIANAVSEVMSRKLLNYNVR